MKLCPKCQKQFSDDANFCPVDAARLVPLEGQSEATPAADPLTQRFQLGGSLGGSRTGAVHQAVDTQTGAAAVVKIIAPEVVALPGVAQRIERELKQLERVQSVGVARVLASGKRGDDWWVATERIEGAQTLAEAISSRGPIPLDQAAHLIEVIGEALIEAAQVGVVHRDLAPKNILFAGGDIKLINFSVPVPTERTPGVPEFVAPEQVDGKPVDQRSNLYSLGALYYYVLTGHPVYAGTSEEVHRGHVSGSIKTPSSLSPVPGPVEAVIMRALDRSPTKRFLTVRQFVDEVSRVARGEASVRTTLPMGKVGRPKAELVQTLLGVRGAGVWAGVQLGPPAAKSAPVASAAAAAAVPAASVPAAEPSVVVAPEPDPAATIQGVGSNASIAPPRSMEAPPMVAPVAVVPDRSPWAPPSEAAPAAVQAQPAAPPPAAIPQQHPAVGAPPAAAPQPAPQAAAPASVSPQAAPAAKPVQAKAAAPSAGAGTGTSAGKSGSNKRVKDKGGKGEKSGKGKFRETLWFKKGELDAQAAAAAAEERARTGRDTGPEHADSLPIDERYKDDGTISHGDKEKYSLRTGGTEMQPALRGRAATSGQVSEDELINELKSGRGKIIALIAAILVVLIVVIVVVAS